MSVRMSLCAIVLAALVGCHSSPPIHPDGVSQHDEPMLGAVAKLAGDWEMTDEKGVTHRASRFAVTSGGSAVREIMWPGNAMEMTNLYHMDGGALVCTHYCAAGNQPRMVAACAETTEEGTVFRFDFESVTNLREAHEHYMGNMTLTILNDGGLREEWRSYDRDGNLTDPMVFELTRASGGK